MKNILNLLYFGFFFGAGVTSKLSSVTTVSETCNNFGFNYQTLQCDTCHDLHRVVGDEDIYNECMDCCIWKVDVPDIYGKAVLEVDQRFVSSFQKSFWNRLGPILKMPLFYTPVHCY